MIDYLWWEKRPQTRPVFTQIKHKVTSFTLWFNFGHNFLHSIMSPRWSRRDHMDISFLGIISFKHSRIVKLVTNSRIRARNGKRSLNFRHRFSKFSSCKRIVTLVILNKILNVIVRFVGWCLPFALQALTVKIPNKNELTDKSNYRNFYSPCVDKFGLGIT